MSNTWESAELHHGPRGLLLPAGLLVAGLLAYFHAPLLTLLGWAGGFRFVARVGPLYLAIGGVLLLVGAWSPDRFDVRSGVLVAAASLPVLVAATFAQPTEPVFTALERVLLYWPVTLALPLGVARVASRRTAALALLGLVAAVWAVLVGLVVTAAPRGPVGVYLAWNVAVAVALAVPVYAVGRAMARGARG